MSRLFCELVGIWQCFFAKNGTIFTNCINFMTYVRIDCQICCHKNLSTCFLLKVIYFHLLGSDTIVINFYEVSTKINFYFLNRGNHISFALFVENIHCLHKKLSFFRKSVDHRHMLLHVNIICFNNVSVV